MKEISLSFSKFNELITKHNYIIEQIFVCDDKCKCIHLKTPKYSKLFLVYIPDKYIMDVPTDNTFPRKEIFRYEVINKKPLDIIKQYNIDNLATISSGLVCLYFNNNNFEFFTIGRSLGKQNKKDDEISLLERKTKSILSKIKTISKEKKEYLKPEDLNDLVPVEGEKEKTEIVFEENDGTVIEKDGPIEQMAVEAMKEASGEFSIKTAKGATPQEPKSVEIEVDPKIEVLSTKVPSDKLTEKLLKLEKRYKKKNKKLLRLRRLSQERHTPESPSSELKSPSTPPKVHQEEIETQPGVSINVLPPEIELKNIMNGALYVMIGINYFFSNIENYENELFSIYEHINVRDEQIRYERLGTIDNLLDDMRKKIHDDFNNLINDERKYKESLDICSRLLLTCSNMKEKIIRNKKLVSNLQEVEKLEGETRTKVETLNLNILEKRDDIETFLDNCKRNIEDFLNDNLITNLEEKI